METNGSTNGERTSGVHAEGCASCGHYSLDQARRGDELQIVHVDDEHARVQCLRFGMAEGACVTCVTRIPAGPLVLRSGRQEIAVGRGLARRIRVRAADRRLDVRGAEASA